MQEKLKEYHTVITDVWKYLKYLMEKYNGIDADNVNWGDVVEKGCEISKQYGENSFVVKIVLACMEEFERLKRTET